MLLSVQTNIFAQLVLDPIKETLHPLPVPPCQNSGFESGNFSNWETFTGFLPVSGGVDLSTLTQNYNTSLHTIVNSSVNDPIGGFPRLNCGNKAAKIGNIQGGTDVSMIKYTFIVTPSNVNFSFRYAMVLQDPNHQANEQPFFQYLLLTGDRSFYTNASQIIASKKFVSASSDPFFTPLNNGLVYKDWSTECINLSAYMGQEVSALFLTADCSLGAHGSYAYVDCLCENNDAIANMTIDQEFCKDDPILMDGTASINEDSYFIGITKVPYTPGEGVNGWFTAQQAGVIDINALANQWGYYFQCGKTYNIKLAVKNNCTNWNEVSKTILIRCVEGIDPIKDFYGCCDDISAIVIGNPNNNPENTYNWTSNPSIYTAGHTNDISFTTTPYQSTEFFVTVTDAYGCTQENSFLYTLKEDFDILVKVDKIGCCSYNITPQVTFIECAETGNEDPMWENIKQNQLTYIWSNGATTRTINVSPSQNTTYTLTVKNGCYSHTVNVFVPRAPNGPFPTLIAANSFIVTSSNPLTNKLIIREFGPNAPADGQPAYNATSYILNIYDRWGGVFRTLTGNNCTILQGEISWDGRDNNGNIVPIDVYHYTLQLKNDCNNSGWVNMCDFVGQQSFELCTKKCWNWWPPGYKCCEYAPCPYSVSVIQ